MIVEIDPDDHSAIATRQLDSTGTPGGIFGIAIAPVNSAPSLLLFVDDNSVTMNVLPLQK